MYRPRIEKPVGAPAGNINAQKWTLGNVEYLLYQMEDLVDEPGVLTLNGALGQCNAYSTLWWRLKRKFCLNEEILHRMEVLEQQFEYKIMHGVLVGRFKEKAARLVLERSARYQYGQSSEEIASGVPDEMVEAVEEQVGHLSDTMKKEIKRRKLLVHVFGKTKAQLMEEGYHIYEEVIYAPHERGYMDKYENAWVPCLYAKLADECEQCREAA